MSQPDPATVLDAAADIVVNDGLDHATLRTIAHRAAVTEVELTELFGSVEAVLAATLNREYVRMYATIVDNIERDPRGGLPSRIYFYSMTAVYEHPLARALYLTNPDALNRITRSLHGFDYQPSTGLRAGFLTRLAEVGMLKDVDERTVSAMLSAFSAGLALMSPSADFDLVIKGMEWVLAELVDADVDDTQPGKIAFYDYATDLTAGRAR